MAANMNTLIKLLSRAEGSDSEHERELSMKRATDLAATLGVELAVARAKKLSMEKSAEPVEQVFEVGTPGPRNGPHNRLLVELFLACASANDVTITVNHDSTLVWGYGFQEDIDIVDRLFVLLEWEMLRAADDAIARGDNVDGLGYRIGVRTFRNAFYDGFISRVRSRMIESRRLAVRNASDSSGDSSGVELAIRDKKAAIDDLKKEKNPHLALPDHKITHWKSQKKDRSWVMHNAIRNGARAGDAVHIGSEPDLPAKSE